MSKQIKTAKFIYWNNVFFFLLYIYTETCIWIGIASRNFYVFGIWYIFNPRSNCIIWHQNTVIKILKEVFINAIENRLNYIRKWHQYLQLVRYISAVKREVDISVLLRQTSWFYFRTNALRIFMYPIRFSLTPC